MEGVLEILKFLLPALALGGTAYLITLRFLEYAQSKQQPDVQKTVQELIIPARMQAYERIVLLKGYKTRYERQTPSE
jgi:hypothetical protein